MVLARGLIGDQQGVPKVACPLHKKNFSLTDGDCRFDARFDGARPRSRILHPLWHWDGERLSGVIATMGDFLAVHSTLTSSG